MSIMLPMPLETATRVQIEEHIEFLLSILDAADGDVSLEPSLGWTEAVNQDSDVRFGATMTDEAEPNGDELDASFTEDEFHTLWV